MSGTRHWVGMTLYNTGHDHGGGDFAVIDGEGLAPRFCTGQWGGLFHLAWFGKERITRTPWPIPTRKAAIVITGESPPFQKSLAIEWGALPA